MLRAIYKGKTNGDKISFTTKPQTQLGDKTFEETHRYIGKLLDGNLPFAY